MSRRAGNTEVLIQHVHEHLMSSGPLTSNQLAERLGINYKTVNRYLNTMKEQGLARICGMENRQYKWEAGKPSLIPSLPANTGTVPMMTLAKFIMEQPVDYMSPLDQSGEKYHYVLMSLLRQAISFNEEQLKSLELFFKRYRESLETRLRVVNYILREPKFWSVEDIQNFKADPTWDEKLVEAAWSRANQPLTEKRREQYTTETSV